MPAGNENMFVWIYVQPLGRICLTVLLGLVAYGLVWFIMKKWNRERLVRVVTGGMWLVWLGAVLMATLHRSSGDRSIQWIPFYDLYLGFTENREMFRAMFMNVLLFLLGGYLGAVLFRRRRRLGGMLCLMSLTIEAAQYVFALGHAELDDLICNTVGGIMGILLWCLWEKLVEHRNV